ncbi:hypothetical protein SOPP22_04310 [Shewanella sp. OPT22]|nr:hypothetical protein SOPP22_04310 [Shewanella sp. OPT22]
MMYSRLNIIPYDNGLKLESLNELCLLSNKSAEELLVSFTQQSARNNNPHDFPLNLKGSDHSRFYYPIHFDTQSDTKKP